MKRSNISLLLVVFFAVSLFSASAFAYSADSVLSHDIKEADGTSGQDTNSGSGIKTGHIQNGAVTTSKVADGAITDAKITGPISRSKIEKYANFIIVAKSGGDFTNPVDAMNSITDASASNPYLVKIMPGVYTLSSPLYMQPYVDIEGSGENTTKITATGLVASQGCNAVGVIASANNSEIRFLTVESIGVPGIYANAAIYSCIQTNPAYTQKITNVTALASGGDYNYAVYIDKSSPLMTNVTARITEGGCCRDMVNLTSASVLRNVTLGTGRMYNFDEYGGSIVVKCLGVYDGNYNPVSCP